MATERESVNFKRTKSLVDSLRAQAKERNTSATDLVIQGLHLILGQTEGIDFSSRDVIDVMHDIITRLEALEVSVRGLNEKFSTGLQGFWLLMSQTK